MTRQPFSAFDALVALKAQIPEDALTAGLLGTERTGHGVRIRDDGLIATIGYLINEATSLWLSAPDGTTVPGIAVGYDFDSGLGLVRPTLPLAGPSVPLGSAKDLRVGDSVLVVSSGGATETVEAEVVARQEFAGRWEYLLDDAIFTAPPHQSWSGAALVDMDGRLCGIGSLIVQGFTGVPGRPVVNMFVPIDLLTPVVDEMCALGRPARAPHPWLGILACDDEDDLTIVGVYRHCPADEAGVKPGDVVLEVAGGRTRGLADMLRRVWALGDAGIPVPLTVMRGDRRLELTIHSGDRTAFLHKGTVQ